MFKSPFRRAEFSGDKAKPLSRKMADANLITGEDLEVLISEISSKISTLNQRETEMNKNDTSEIDLVERYVLLRRIKVERREHRKELDERLEQKAMLDNYEKAAQESSNDDDDGHDDDYDPKTAYTLELADARAAEYSRLNNLSSRKRMKLKVERVK